MTVDEAADALEDLDHDFFLFQESATGCDAVLYWREDGLLALIEPRSAKLAEDRGPVFEQSRFSTPIELDAAVRKMNAV